MDNYFWELDIAGILVSIVLFFVMIFRKSFPTLQRKIFKILIGICILSSSFEILMLVSGSSILNLPIFFEQAIPITYYLIHAALHYVFMLYVISSFRGHLGTLAERITFTILFVLEGVLIITNPLHNLVFVINPETTELTVGPLISIIEVLGAGSLIYSLILTIYYKNKLNSLQLGLDIFFIFIWLFSIILETLPYYIDFFGLEGIFVENYIVTITFSILTIVTDNPNQYFYYKTTVYNEDTFNMVYSDKFKKNIPFKLIAFNFKDFDLYIQKVGKRRAGVAIDETLKHCAKRFGQNNVFGLGRSVVAIDARAFKDLESECKSIAADCYEGGLRANPDCKLYAQFAMFDCPNDCSNITDLHTAIYLMLFGQDKLSNEKIITHFDKKDLESRHHREEIVMKIHDAIENDGFEMHYQPLYSWKKDKYLGLEALIRFKQNDGPYISPGEFIPIAEEEGLIFALDEIVFEKVCRFIRNSNLKKYGVQFIDINLSLLKLLDSTTVDRYIELASRYEVDPKFINLEITETAEGDEKYLSIIRQNIQRFRDHGFNFSLDDYGSGYSTVIYMAEMDAKIVKIDASILWNAMKNKKYFTVLENSVRLIYCFDKECVCEGVETEDMAKLLQRLGVEYFQGYLYSKPVNETAILKVLEEKNGIKPIK